jgi:hypothetical protein
MGRDMCQAAVVSMNEPLFKGFVATIEGMLKSREDRIKELEHDLAVAKNLLVTALEWIRGTEEYDGTAEDEWAARVAELCQAPSSAVPDPLLKPI